VHREADASNETFFAGLWKAVQIPGVVEFAFCLLFCKLVAYTFIYWTPYYLVHNGFSATHAGYLCTFVDIGGIAGGILAGFLRDRLRRPACIAFGFLTLTVPGLLAYRTLSAAVGDRLGPNIALMLGVGMLVNGPYALITTAVTADLGSHKSLQGKGSSHMVATVAGLIDGTGSIGSAIQGVAIGTISTLFGWNFVFYFLMICCALAALCLLRLCMKELKQHGTCN
jgi:OPA family glycerol-3-phosphate transporter-like MFS transporter 1/2